MKICQFLRVDCGQAEYQNSEIDDGICHGHYHDELLDISLVHHYEILDMPPVAITFPCGPMLAPQRPPTRMGHSECTKDVYLVLYDHYCHQNLHHKAQEHGAQRESSVSVELFQCLVGVHEVLSIVFQKFELVFDLNDLVLSQVSFKLLLAAKMLRCIAVYSLDLQPRIILLSRFMIGRGQAVRSLLVCVRETPVRVPE